MMNLTQKIPAPIQGALDKLAAARADQARLAGLRSQATTDLAAAELERKALYADLSRSESGSAVDGQTPDVKLRRAFAKSQEGISFLEAKITGLKDRESLARQTVETAVAGVCQSYRGWRLETAAAAVAAVDRALDNFAEAIAAPLALGRILRDPTIERMRRFTLLPDKRHAGRIGRIDHLASGAAAREASERAGRIHDAANAAVREATGGVVGIDDAFAELAAEMSETAPEPAVREYNPDPTGKSLDEVMTFAKTRQAVVPAGQ